MRKLVLLAAVSALSTAASAQSITTLFQSNNGGSAGGGVYFDIVVGSMPIEITGFDTNTSAAIGTVVPFRVFTAANTSFGNQSNPAAWTLQASGTGISAGTDRPTPIEMTNSFLLNANTSYGLALTLSSATGTPGPAAHRYSGTGTNPAPGQLQYSNADVTLNLGSATNVLFSGTPFIPRVWNGTIYYRVIPEPATAALLALGGLLFVRRR